MGDYREATLGAPAPDAHTLAGFAHGWAEKKLGKYADHYIETIVGIGYRFRPMPWLPN